MPMVCTVCRHEKKADIDDALIKRTALRYVAESFGVSAWALRRHKAKHLPDSLVKAEEVKDVADADRVMLELRRILERTNLVFDACDRWLRDPEDPNRYEIGPRAEDVKVTYTETNADHKPVRKKTRLSELLKRAGVEESKGLEVELIETKHADPRELVLKAASQSHANIELLAELIGKLNRSPQVNILVSTEWLSLRTVIMRTLEPHPDARLAVVEALQARENQQPSGEVLKNGSGQK